MHPFHSLSPAIRAGLAGRNSAGSAARAGPARADPAGQRPARPAAGRGGPGALPIAVPVGAAGRLGPAIHPGGHGTAQVLLALPIVAALAHRDADGIWHTYGNDLRINGAARVQAIRTVLAIGRAERLTTVLAGFGRTVSEVGAVLVVGGQHRGLHAHDDDLHRARNRPG